jgi:hypothetical protein
MREPLKHSRGHIHIIAALVIIALLGALIAAARQFGQVSDLQVRVTDLERRMNQVDGKIEVLERK